MKNNEVVIREVMLRDGLQNIPEFIPTEAKIWYSSYYSDLVQLSRLARHPRNDD